MAVGRNDPCPCGSGKKYKKCCHKKEAVEKRVAERSRRPDEELEPDATLYAVWQQWRSARARSDFNFLYDLIEPGTALAERVGARDTFVAACVDGVAPIPSGEPAQFRHLCLRDGARADLLQTLGDDDSAASSVRCERVAFAKTERGWRFTDFEVVEVCKDRDDPIRLSLFE